MYTIVTLFKLKGDVAEKNSVWSFTKGGGSAREAKKQTVFLKKGFFRSYSEPDQDPQNMFYTWSGVLFTDGQNTNTEQKKDSIKEQKE